MLKRASCRSCTCIYRGRVQKRSRSTATVTSETKPQSILVENTAPGATHDDRVLRDIFDSKIFWKDFSQPARFGYRGSNVGLFQNRYLTAPEGFAAFAQENLMKSKKIVKKVMGASSLDDYRSIVRDLDRLSDMLCRVTDLSDFVRSTHPDRDMQAAASRAQTMMLKFMNILNTTSILNDKLGIAMANPDVMNYWSEEERVVAQSLRRDFAKSAINLPDTTKDAFVRLSGEISQIGQAFVDHIGPATAGIMVQSNRLKGLDPILVKSINSWGRAMIPTAGSISMEVLRGVQDEDIRREVFIAGRTTPQTQHSRLHELLRKRAELSKLTGHESYAQMTLADRMAKSPDSVNQFLHALSRQNKPKVQQEMDEILKAKMKYANNQGVSLLPWEKDFYANQLRSSMRSSARTPDFLASYFSLGTVMQGLSRLFSRLYGVRFVPHETMPGETWNDDVRRLDVVSETDGHVAVLYCDLFSRPGKSPNPAHFTLRCSREIAKEEIEEARSSPKKMFSTPEEDVNDGMATSATTGVLKQLPTIALICDFQADAEPSLLTFAEVRTLFHEMGHAIHSILGRTALQEVSGTRCAADFAELPSILMEYFAADPSVLGLFARHYRTDQPLPFTLIAEKIALDERFAGSDMENQIILSMVDQAYHSSLPLDPFFDSTKVYHELQRAHGVLPPDPVETSWQGFFGHLYGYGATYYSYLFDRALAKRIWQVAFKSGKDGASISRANGEKMKDSVLRWGGGRDPWACVADVLDDGRVEGGDEKAMAIVGSWLGEEK
jgi:mitochondrial intermediate peptidase